MLTEKQKNFCRAYVRNNGNGTQAYLTAYNSKSETSAAIESSKLLRRDDITEYINTLNKPMENRIQNEREKKREVLWDIIHAPDANYNDICRAMDILNKMDSEYISISKTIDDGTPDIKSLDTDTLIKLVK